MTSDARAAAKEIVSRVSKVRFKNGVSSAGDINDRIDSLIRLVSQESTKIARRNTEWDQGKVNSELLNQSNVRQQADGIKQDIGSLNVAYELAKNERKQLAKIEHGQGWRRVIWRAASTASVAAVILLTWYLAHKWGIPLPLMRAPSSIAAGAP